MGIGEQRVWGRERTEMRSEGMGIGEGGMREEE